MKKLSKLLALALTLCMILSCISVVAFAAETQNYERTILSLSSAADVSTYGWGGNGGASVSWDATENACKYVPTGDGRLQVNWYILPVEADETATYTLKYKIKGVAMDDYGKIGAYGINTDDPSYSSGSALWGNNYFSISRDSAVKGETDAEGYTEWTYKLDFQTPLTTQSYFTSPKKTYYGMIRFHMSMPQNITAYIKDLKLVTNKSEGSDYVTKNYTYISRDSADDFHFNATEGVCPSFEELTDTDGDKIFKLNYKNPSIRLNKEYTFEATGKYRLSFDAWIDSSASASGATNYVMFFNGGASNSKDYKFSTTKTRTHYDIDFAPSDVSATEDYSTVNLQFRLGRTDNDFLVNFTDIKIQKLESNTVDTIVKVGANGSVKAGNVENSAKPYTFANNESLPVVSGTAVKLDIVPDSGYQIASVTYNNVDITPADREAASQITITPTSDAVLNVEFEVIPPKIPALVKGANQKTGSFTIGETVYNKVNYIQYAKIDNYSALDVAGAGITISDGTNSLDLPAVSIAADGSFAIRVFGNAITEDGTYTFTPYMNVN